MSRVFLIFSLAIIAAFGSLVAAFATAQTRDDALRGYVDPTTNANLPYRIPRLGVNADLNQYAAAEIETQLERMVDANVTWVRQAFPWNLIELEPGQYEWTPWDTLVEAVDRYPQLELVAVLTNSPAWALNEPDSHVTAPPQDPAAFARFVTAFAERFGESIDVYQIWDEPNLTTGWGMSEPQPAAYIALLAEAYTAIHAADADATVIAAGLAPTTELGPLNISDITYLDQLYRLGADQYMDAVAAKPYGFSVPPDDRTIDNAVLNFSRIVALREVMLAHNDGQTALWASNFGWNALPNDWQGEPSIWGQVTSEQRTMYTLAAIERAEREWPWLGGLILQHWQPQAEPDDPQWGYTLVDPSSNPTPLLQALAQQETPQTATNGLYAPANPFARYSGVWTFGPLGADIGWIGDSRLAFDFTGRALSLLVREGDYVAYLYPTIDGNGRLANSVPTDSSGNPYLILTSADLQPRLSLIPVATSLPLAPHTLTVVTDRGSDQWALAGYAVSSGDLAEPYNRQITVAVVVAALAGLAAAISAFQLPWARIVQPLAGTWNRLGDALQLGVSAVTSVALLIGMLLTWGDATPAILRREPVQIVIAVLTAGIVYLEPGFLVTVTMAVLLFIIFFHRVEYVLILTLFYAPFFLFPVELYRFAFPMAELLILIGTAAWLLRSLVNLGRARQASVNDYKPALRSWLRVHVHPMDFAVIAFVCLGFLSLLWSLNRGPAITEFRTLFVEPAVFYLIFRTTRLDRTTLVRLVDALLLAGVVVALIGLWLYLRGESVITAEEGTLRLASVYGSPNNVGLFLGRCLPFAFAYLLLPLDRLRRGFAGISLILMVLAVLLSMSAGALFIGLPIAIGAVLALIWGRRALPVLAALAVFGVTALVLASRSARFERIFDLTEGTNFFRLRVWESALNIIRDYPLTGLGLDQFLYAYRGHYILPDAWQEPNLSHPHNFLLDFWVRLGVLGVMLFILIQLIFWRTAVLAFRRLHRASLVLFALLVGAMGSMLNLLAHGLVDNSVFVLDLSYVFVFLLGLVVALSNIRPIDAGDETMV